VSIRGISAVVSVECVKLLVQMRTLLVLAVCLLGPFVFAAAMRIQNSLPTDTLFGRSVKESGFAIPLVVLGFAALWGFPVLTSIVGGDLFAGEDRYGTWKTMLSRSRSRAEIFIGKVITALGFSTVAIVALAVSSIAAGVIVIGSAPLIDLSGVLRPSDDALHRVALAWASILPPAFGFTAFAVLLSVISRSSMIGVGLPVVVGLTMQLLALVDSPEYIRRLMITSAFGAWHGLFAEPSFYRPMLHGTIVSGVYFVLCMVIAYDRLRRRDIAG
jgi:ABC-2 type transport system permease protein